jgi:polygalacturonase
MLLRTLSALGVAAFPIVAWAGQTITVSTTIQAAVDAANAGDTIVVPPGTYHETVVVDKDDLTIRGSVAANLDAAGHEFGIRVGTGDITGDPPVCPPVSVHNFTLDGLTIRNSDDIGIFLIALMRDPSDSYSCHDATVSK